ncbi:hypothetical protein HanPSC8_Chr03g0094311 [Helianthus annuus]|nr:hypothetical protein HanPSC8_Chr03g0094311 [Helianthus annuus]
MVNESARVPSGQIRVRSTQSNPVDSVNLVKGFDVSTRRAECYNCMLASSRSWNDITESR